MDRDELDARLDVLQSKLPQMLDDYVNEEEFWAAFAEEADPLTAGAIVPEDAAHVEARIAEMLAAAGVER